MVVLQFESSPFSAAASWPDNSAEYRSVIALPESQSQKLKL